MNALVPVDTLRKGFLWTIWSLMQSLSRRLDFRSVIVVYMTQLLNVSYPIRYT